MKKNLPLAIVLLILVGAVIFLITKNSETTVKKEISDFAVKDTAAITKIFLADRNGNTITLERKNNVLWTLNKKDTPKQEFLKLLFDAIYRINVRTQVAKAGYNNVVRQLSSSGVKCEIYLNYETKPFKVYYVGGQTEDALGTFMMLENSSTPFITEIPGFNGYLTPRYSVNYNAWKSTLLIDYSSSQIKSVEVDYMNFPGKSFRIIKDDRHYNISSPGSNTFIGIKDTIPIQNYLSLFRNIHFENEASLSSHFKDSILRIPAPLSMKVENEKDSVIALDIYPMEISENSLSKVDSSGRPLKYDADRMYGFFKNDSSFLILQHYTFDKLFREIFDFIPQKNSDTRK